MNLILVFQSIVRKLSAALLRGFTPPPTKALVPPYSQTDISIKEYLTQKRMMLIFIENFIKQIIIYI